MNFFDNNIAEVRAKVDANMSIHDMLTVLVKHGLILGHPYILTRDELIDRVVDAMASELSL